MPLDDRALQWLQFVATADPPQACATLLRAALGDATTYAWRIAKGPCRAAAAALGVRLPAGAAVENLQRALTLADRLTWPVVLKANLGTAGRGVAICRNADALRAAWARIGNHPTGASLEQAIPGVPAMMAVAVWDGVVLAGMAARKERCSFDGIGPSSVIRFIEHAEMAEVARRLCAQFGSRGLISFDFILDSEGRAWFLECNHRPVPIHHLGHLAAQDLVAALATTLHGTPAPAQGSACTRPIALFPQERMRDPSSQFLFPPAIEDVPVEDPGLLDRYRQLLAR
jgi:predicted ATP-grasp superfamily ATP-dependent carboligase